MISREWLDDGLAARPDNQPDVSEETREYFIAKNIMDMAHMDEMFKDRGKDGNRDFILGYATALMDMLEGIVSTQERVNRGDIPDEWTSERIGTLMVLTIWQYLKDLSMDQDLMLYQDVAMEKMVQKFMDDPQGFLEEMRAKRRASGDTDNP